MGETDPLTDDQTHGSGGGPRTVFTAVGGHLRFGVVSQLLSLLGDRFHPFILIGCIDTGHGCFQFIAGGEEDPLLRARLTQNLCDQFPNLRIFIGQQGIRLGEDRLTTIADQQNHAVIFVAGLRGQVEERLHLQTLPFDGFFLSHEMNRPVGQILTEDILEIGEADGQEESGARGELPFQGDQRIGTKVIGVGMGDPHRIDVTQSGPIGAHPGKASADIADHMIVEPGIGENPHRFTGGVFHFKDETGVSQCLDFQCRAPSVVAALRNRKVIRRGPRSPRPFVDFGQESPGSPSVRDRSSGNPSILVENLLVDGDDDRISVVLDKVHQILQT